MERPAFEGSLDTPIPSPSPPPSHTHTHTQMSNTFVIRKPLALCYISDISSGEHPPNSAVLGKILCGACQRQPGREAKRQKQHY